MWARAIFLVCLTTAAGCRGRDAPAAPGDVNTQMPEATSAAVQEPSQSDEVSLEERARRLAHETIILDGHVDVPWRLYSSRTESGALSEDVSGSAPEGDFDHPRAVRGGLDAPFMSIYVPARFEKGGAKKVADELIDIVEGIVAAAPDKFALASTPEQVRANFERGLISLPMGMENGSPIERDLANVEHFHRRGIRYITLAHAEDNHLSDSSYDDRNTHKGLSDFGEQVVAEMNRLGIMVDVSHLSDEAFADVMRVTKVPVIASHSSCRHFTPGFERNMSDEMIAALADNGGVIQINFGSAFLDGDIQAKRDARREALKARLDAAGLSYDDPEAEEIIESYDADHPMPFADLDIVADHIDHVVKLVGVEHVGFGSDFDGVGDSLPVGLKDVSQYPNLIAKLLERGYSEADIEKMASGNVLRVWQAVEDYAAKQRASK